MLKDIKENMFAMNEDIGNLSRDNEELFIDIPELKNRISEKNFFNH